MPPTTVDDVLVVLNSGFAEVDVLANDTAGNGAIAPATVAIGTGPANGTIININPANGAITYQHDGSATTADSFTYTVADSNGAVSLPATVNVTVAEVPPGMFVSDDFNSCDLDPVWTFVNPLADAPAPTIQGAFSGDAQVAIAVPGGSTHEPWNGAIGAPHIRQSTTDGDFTLEVKWNSTLPPVNYAEQGILVLGDGGDWLRFDFYSVGSALRVFAGTAPGNTSTIKSNEVVGTVTDSPMYLRVQRTGDVWTQSYSFDGTGWTQATGTGFTYALTVNGIGLFAGNASGNPAHTALVDYFSNSLAPVTGSDDLGQNTLTTVVVGNGTVGRDLDLPAYTCGDLVQLTANPDPGWTFASWSGDLTGNTNPATISMDRASIVTATFVPAGPPEAPVAVDDAAVVLAGNSAPIDVVANDTDANNDIDRSTVTVVTPPVNGSLPAIDPVTGVVTYLHDGGVALADSFTYTVDDLTALTSNTATVRVTITPLVPPTAVDDALVVLSNGTGNVDVLLNDTPGSGAIDPATVAIASFPTEGTITGIDPVTGVVSYQHGGSGATTDSFTYTVADINGAVSLAATVTVTITQLPPGMFVSDDFNSCDLDPVWTFVDPQGDGSPPVIQGAFSGDAKVAISVPSGGPHELYNGVIAAPHILQSTTDDDFTLEAKFDSSLPSASYGEQGIVVRADAGSWLRFEFYSTVTGQLNILTGTPVNGSFPVAPTALGLPAGTSPMYMRVQRVGDDWTQSWSTDGTAWTAMGTFSYPLNVTGVGLYAGNAGTNPAHTVLVDYFSNSLAPVTGSDDLGQNTLTTVVVGNGTIDRNPDLTSYTCGDMVELTANPAPGWFFSSWSGDLTGSTNPATVTMDGPLTVTANFTSAVVTTVAANTSGVVGLSTANTCESGVPVEINRSGAENMRGFTATVELTNLALCAGTASIVEGTYLSGSGATQFTVTDNLDGTYLVVGDIVGAPCGAIAPSGVLFTLDVTNTIADGIGTIDLTGVEIRDCDSVPLAATSAPGDIVIDTTAPANLTGLGGDQVLTGNPAGNTTAINLTWTPSVDGTAVQTVIYRKGFGTYPEYDDTGGAAPTAPADPVAEGWELAAALPAQDASFDDLTGDRNVWYFAAVTTDLYGNRSASLMTGGILNYVLGDVSDGGAPIADGDNHVFTADLTLLGSRYGTNDGDALYLNTLDVGPTDDMSVAGRPTTDDAIDFEDLILFGINYDLDATQNGATQIAAGAPQPADRNTVALDFPILPGVGETFVVDLVMVADGQVQGLQVPLLWDDNVLTITSFQGGPLLADQGGPSLVLSATAGVVDITLAGVRERGIAGAGTVATATFQVVGTGPTGLQIGGIVARDAANQPVTVTTATVTDVGDDQVLPRVSTLNPNYPNPFNPMTTISFDLAGSGRVRIAIFSIDGRLVKTLVDESFAAGRHERVWDGKDGGGRTVASGTYLYIMEAPGIRQTRRMLLVK